MTSRTRTRGAEREVRFEGYEPLGGGWIATEIKFMRDGRVDVFELRLLDDRCGFRAEPVRQRRAQPTRVGAELKGVSVQGAALEGRSAVVCTGKKN